MAVCPNDLVRKLEDHDLKECAGNILELHRTGVLPPDTAMRKLMAKVREVVPLDTTATLKMVEDMVLIEVATRWIMRG